MKAFARFTKDFGEWIRHELINLQKNNNSVKYLPVRQVLFGRTVNAEKMKLEDSKETVTAFFQPC